MQQDNLRTVLIQILGKWLELALIAGYMQAVIGRVQNWNSRSIEKDS